jgi:hypothetical protein
MTTFNLISYENGRIIKTINAETMQEAQNYLDQKGYGCQEDYFLESVATTKEYNQKESRTIYTNEIR